MANKPMGAAFSHARAVGDSQSRAAQRRRANSFLRERGHAPIGKGVMDRWRALTVKERQDLAFLQSQGFAPDIARALAQAGSSPARKTVAKGDGHAPPQGVQSACKRGLELAPEYGGSGLTEGAKARARSMAAGNSVSTDQLARMRSFFARHSSYSKSSSPPSPGYVSWLLWGGDAGKRWAESKSDVEKSVSITKRDYASAYVEAAKGMLPEDLHQAIHRKARGSAGGIGARRARAGARDEDKAAAMAEYGELSARAKKLLASVDKAGPTIAELSPDGMTGNFPGVDPKKKVNKSTSSRHQVDIQGRSRVQKRDSVAKTHVLASTADDIIDHVFENRSPADADKPEVATFMDAQRLVAGMDFERLNGIQDPEEARARASRVLSSDMGHYDAAFPGDSDIKNVGGLNLDLGSGFAREAGYLGVDVYPADYGTIIHDVGMGLPFADASARAIRLINALKDMPDYRNAPMPLLLEVQRVLAIGGRFYYVGVPLDGLVDWERLPGLEVILDNKTSAETINGPQTQTLVCQRQAAKLPVVYGADTRYLSVDETMPQDLQMALEAWGQHPKADVAMANLVHKRAPVEAQVKVIKKDSYQQVAYGVVLSPEEVDSQNDVMSAEEIRKTAHQFLINARVVGREHENPFEGAHVVESFIAPFDMAFDGQYGPQQVSQGSWVLGVHIANEQDWNDVLKGEFTGFSVGGWGDRKAA